MKLIYYTKSFVYRMGIPCARNGREVFIVVFDLEINILKTENILFKRHLKQDFIILFIIFLPKIIPEYWHIS